MVKKASNMYETLNNLKLAIDGAKALGCQIINIGPKDLYDKNVSLFT